LAQPGGPRPPRPALSTYLESKTSAWFRRSVPLLPTHQAPAEPTHGDHRLTTKRAAVAAQPHHGTDDFANRSSGRGADRPGRTSLGMAVDGLNLSTERPEPARAPDLITFRDPSLSFSDIIAIKIAGLGYGIRVTPLPATKHVLREPPNA
jgi:hypothetical protein